MRTFKAGMVMGWCLVLGNISCGNQSAEKEPEQVEVRDLGWVDENATLKPGRSLAIEGQVEANANAQVSFSINNAADKPVQQSESTLAVTNQNPPAGKDSFYLQDDMKVHVVAGDQVCNGDYTLLVKVTAGRSSVNKPLYFKVVEGKDCAFDLGDNSLTGAVHNVLGPKEGAFDLINGRIVRKSEANATKDLLDLTNLGSRTSRGGFRMTLGTGNGARFIVDNSVTYSDVSESRAREVFSRSNGDRVTPVLHVGDVVYVKLGPLRAPNAIYVLSITKVDDTSDPSAHGTNGGVIEFKYRRVVA